MEGRPISERRESARKRERHHYTQRRQQVIAAAAHVFQTKGFAEASINDVAEAAQLNRATVYYYVQSKEELFEIVVMDALERNVDMAEALHQSADDPRSKLEQLVIGLLQSYAEHYPHMNVYIQEGVRGSTDDGGAIRNLEHRFQAAFTGVITQGIETGTFRSDLSATAVSFGLLGMINWTHRWFRPQGALTAEELGKQFVALMESGVLHPVTA
jgi:AcrR family transcriptional regulator